MTAGHLLVSYDDLHQWILKRLESGACLTGGGDYALFETKGVIFVGDSPTKV